MPEATNIGIAAIANGQSFPSGGSTSDGFPILLEVQPIGATSGLKTATGSVAFTIDNQPAVSVPINVAGVASWVTPPAAAAGTHSVTASYSGDASYNASQSSAFSYAVQQGHTGLNLGPGGICGTGTTCTAIAGDTIPIEVALELIGPQTTTAPVTVTLGSQSQTVALTEEGFFREQDLTGIAKFSNLAPGTYPLTASYSGDSNYVAASGGLFSIVVMPASGSRASTTTTVSESSPIVQFPAGISTTFTVTVTGAAGSNTPPTGAVTVYTNGLGVTPISLSPSGPSSSSGTSGPEVGDGFQIGLNQITAVYTGDNTYQESVSAPITLTAIQNGAGTPDFNLAPAVPQFVVPKGSSANTAINLTSAFGFSGTVNLACTPSDATVTCAISPASLNVSESTAGVATLTVTSTGSHAALGYSVPPSRELWPLAGSLVLGFVLLAGGRKKIGSPRFAMSVATLTLLMICVACGGGGKSGGKIVAPPPPPTPPTPLNAHTVVVTGGANGISHNVKVIVVVQ